MVVGFHSRNHLFTSGIQTRRQAIYVKICRPRVESFPSVIVCEAPSFSATLEYSGLAKYSLGSNYVSLVTDRKRLVQRRGGHSKRKQEYDKQ
jgi:hypothetical protein